MTDDPQRTAVPLSPAWLDHEAVITPRDKVEDVAWWREHGSALTNALLDAKSEGGAAP